MNLRLRLFKKNKEISDKELLALPRHNIFHWFLVVLGTILMGFIFTMVGILMIFSGWFLFQTGVSWLAIMVGFPLILVGLSMILINLYQILAAALDRRYSQTHCLFCKKELT